MGQLQETNWTKIKRAFPSLLGYSRLTRDPTRSARARWYSLEDDFEVRRFLNKEENQFLYVQNLRTVFEEPKLLFSREKLRSFLFQLPPGLKAFCEGREGTAGIDELKSRVAKLDSLDAVRRSFMEKSPHLARSRELTVGFPFIRCR